MDCLRLGCGADVKGAGAQSRGGSAVVGFLDRYGLVILAVFVLVALPLGLDSFRLGLAAKYLCFAFPAVGIVLLWGYGGVLSLGQGVFFGLGSYMMAMFLKLESAANAESSSGTQLAAFFGTAGLPDFMAWNSVEKLPWWWEPFHHVWFMIPAILIIPAALAFLLGYANFRRRVSGVYFAIVTLSVSAIMAILIIGQQGLTGGINGITDFKTFLGMDLDNDRAKLVMYFITAVLLLCIVAAGQFILRSRLGRVLVAIRDGGDRVRFTGYDSAMFQAFVFAVAAMFAAIGGAMFTIQIGLASPALVGIIPSIEMVIYAAVGGRLSLIGAVYGAFLVNFAKTFFSENFVEYWIYFIGALFVIVVMFLPKGLAGILDYFRGRTKVER
ncbi:urea ABC transporter permease subunit UrtC [Gammaproteobacteria bacterium]|nr:urea ABC transporter permease subunit UrtC [Gammaproteobacteria bacterium]